MSTNPSSCLLCGCQCKQHLFTSQGDNNGPDSISDEINRLDRTIHRLIQLKFQHCSRLNAICSKTKTLPDEILLSIFRFFCSLFDSNQFPHFILGGVCTHWRNLLNGAPLFWKKINLQTRNFQQAVSLLELFKERNGPSFESMQLKFDRSFNPREPPIQRLVQSIGGVLTLEKITVFNPPVDLLRIINHLDTRDVSLSCLSYRLLSVPGFSLPWSTLTTLTLSHIEINTCCDLLLGCPNLIQFSSSDPLSPTGNTGPSTQQAQETCFPRLQHLTWYHLHSEWDGNLLSLYRFPALEYFHWLGGLHGYPIELFHDFISSLPQSCRIFHLSAPENHNVRLGKAILLQIEHPVERLICSNFTFSGLFVVLERLQDPSFIPSLTSFVWENRSKYRVGEKWVLKLTRSFHDALQGRFKIGVGRFRIQMEGLVLRSEFEAHDRKKVYELMDYDWFDFEIAENGDWIMSF